MIVVRLRGGLGNQLFQYAAAYALAQRRGVSVDLDASCASLDPARPYQLSAFNIEANFADVRLAPGKLTDAIRALHRKEYRNFGSVFDPSFFSLPDGTALNGYFQSWRYIDPVQPRMREMLTLKSQTSGSARTLVSQIASTAMPVSIHVRRGDYLSPESSRMFNTLGRGYYETAMAVLRGLLGYEPHYFLFSDDPVWVHENLAGLAASTVVEGQDKAPWEDLTLMSQCRHHIIANSSFSWWGAWLNPRPDKWVIAPRQWFTAEALREKNICDLLPPEWIAV